MNVLVLGAGTVGSVFGGLLAGAGHRVIFLGRKPVIELISHRGISIEGIWGSHRVTNIRGYATLSQLKDAEGSGFDLALLAVKAYDTTMILEQVKEVFPTPFPVVSLQNGLGNLEEIARLRGSENALAATYLLGIETTKPLKVHITGSAVDLRIGGTEGRVPWETSKEVSSLFSQAGILALPTEKITPYLWEIVLYHCALTSLSTVLGVHGSALFEDPSARLLITDIITEAFQIIKREQIGLEWTDAQAFLGELFGHLGQATSRYYPIMLRDIENRRKTEIDALNGEIVRRAQYLGLDVPVNWLITNLVKVKEKIAAGGSIPG